MKITKIQAREILDSRGNPTIEVDAYCGNVFARAAVPSGASTGIYEAVELRDKEKRCMGLGVRKAVQSCALIGRRIKGMDPARQREIDRLMIEMDGTSDKSRLGANAILGISMAVARLGAVSKGLTLSVHISKLSKRKPAMPIPFSNVINGGRHAGTELRIQEFMIAADRAASFHKAVEATIDTYHVLKKLSENRFGRSSVNVGDEGGFALPVSKAEDALKMANKAIDEAGYSGIMHTALDCAASEFYNRNGIYLLHKQFTRKTISDYYEDLISRYGIISIEDPFDQEDYLGFTDFTSRSRIPVIGDDLLVTNPERIRMAVDRKLCNGLLLKVNQIGTLTEALEAADIAFRAGWKVMVSHRSGETEDSFISDLAVGIGCGQIKLGAPCRGERTAKYNQLLRIEETFPKLKYGSR